LVKVVTYGIKINEKKGSMGGEGKKRKLHQTFQCQSASLLRGVIIRELTWDKGRSRQKKRFQRKRKKENRDGNASLYTVFVGVLGANTGCLRRETFTGLRGKWG